MSFILALILIIIGFLLYRMIGPQNKILMVLGLVMLVGGLWFLAYVCLHSIDLI